MVGAGGGKGRPDPLAHFLFYFLVLIFEYFNY